MAPNAYFGFLQYENFAAIIIGTEINIYSKCVIFKNDLLKSDTVPLMLYLKMSFIVHLNKILFKIVL